MRVRAAGGGPLTSPPSARPQRTRAAVLSTANPYFFSGPAGEGVGGPHVGLGYIWPMSIMMRSLTATVSGACTRAGPVLARKRLGAAPMPLTAAAQNQSEVQDCLDMLVASSAGTGFMHERWEG